MDFSRLWGWLALHAKAPAMVTLALLLFGAGWQTGRVMSPYYTAHPIVFSEVAVPDEIANQGGSPEELAQLQAAGVALRSPQPATAQAAVAGLTTGVEEVSAVGGQFVGSKNSDLYHLPDCPSAKRIKQENQRWFSSQEEAAAAGYSPSKCTEERLPGGS